MRGKTPAIPATPRPSPRVRTAPPRRVSTSRHITRLAAGSRTDRSATWDATPRIAFSLFIIGVGNAVSSFLAGTTGIAGLALYLLTAVPTFVYEMSYVVIGAGMVVEAATECVLEAVELTVEVSNGDDGGEGRDSSDDRGDDTESPACD